MKKLFAILSVVALALVTLVSCKQEEEVNKLFRVTPSVKSVVLAAGETAEIVISFTPKSEATSLTWETSDESIVTVVAKDDTTGVVTAIGPGAAVVRAVAGSIVGVVDVDVFGGGNSAWSVIGDLHGANWDKDFAGVDKEGYVLFEHVALAKGNEFKLRKDKDWGVNRGTSIAKGAYTVGTAFKAVANGGNLACGADGFYDIYYIEPKEAIIVLAAGSALPADKDIPDYASVIKIDGDMSDWADVTGVTGTGINAALKVTADSKNIYFYSKRTTERMDEVWAGAAYFYYAFELDDDATTGVSLWDNGPYEILLVFYPFAGTAEAPAFGVAAAGAAVPDGCSVANAKINGVVTESGVETEISVPLSDLIALPSTAFKVISWGNKGAGDKLTAEVTLE